MYIYRTPYKSHHPHMRPALPGDSRQPPGGQPLLGGAEDALTEVPWLNGKFSSPQIGVGRVDVAG